MKSDSREASTAVSCLVAAIERGEAVFFGCDGAPFGDPVQGGSGGSFRLGIWGGWGFGPVASGSLDHMAAPASTEGLDAMTA
jgi:hypothetical protein